MNRAEESDQADQIELVIVYQDEIDPAQMAYEILTEAGLDVFALDSPVRPIVPVHLGGIEPGKVRLAVPTEQVDQAEAVIEAWQEESAARAALAEREFVIHLIGVLVATCWLAAAVFLVTRDPGSTILAGICGAGLLLLGSSAWRKYKGDSDGHRESQ